MMKRRVQLQREVDKQLLVGTVLADLVNGETTANVIRKLKEGLYEVGHYKDNPMSEVHAYRILHSAMDESKSEARQDRETLRAMMLNRYLAVYQQSVTDNDKSNAIKALDSLCKLLGLNATTPTTAIQVNNGKDGLTINFGFTPVEEISDGSENDDD